MSMTDPIADMLTRIRNAVRAQHTDVAIPGSKQKRHIAEILKQEGYIGGWRVEDATVGKSLVLELKYGPNGEKVLQRLRRVSKPGRRIYSKAKELRPVLNGLGITVISTSRGVISDREARRDNIGGEVLCEIW